MNNFLPILCCLIPAIMGLSLLIYRLPAIRRQQKLLCWPRVKAKFNEGELEEALPVPYVLRPEDKEFYTNSFLKPYIYYLSAWKFEGHRILKGEQTSHRNERIKRLLDMVQSVPSFLVYVNPSNPAESFLDAGDGRLSWKSIVLFAGLVFCSLILLIMYREGFSP